MSAARAVAAALGRLLAAPAGAPHGKPPGAPAPDPLPSPPAAAAPRQAFPLRELRELLLEEEGTRLEVYDDATGKPIVPGTKVVGHPTIGIGRALDTRGISAAEAEVLLASDLRALAEELPRRIPGFAGLDPARQVVLAAMAFQMGVKGLQGFRGTLGLVMAGRYAQAAEAMLQSLWAKQTPERAGRMAAIMRTGTLA